MQNGSKWLLFILVMLSISGCQPRGSEQSTILYLSWDEQQQLQLFAQTLNAPDAIQLTEQLDGIAEYQLSPDQSKIVYISTSVEQFSEIWLMTLNGRIQTQTQELLYVCPNSHCSQFIWAPDSRRLIFEMRELDQGDFGQPSLWWLDTETGSTALVLPEVEKPAYAAALSPDGKWLTYNVPSEERVYGYNFENGRFITIQGAMGTPPVWHPYDNTFLINDLNITVIHGDEGDDHREHSHDFVESVHLFSVNTTSELREAMTEAGQVDDAYPVYSPDGEWIVFGRRLARTNTGRQLWLMKADGSEKRALTDTVLNHHSVVRWSGNGRFILYQTVNLADRTAPPSLWMLEIDTGEATLLVENGIQGRWFVDS